MPYRIRPMLLGRCPFGRTNKLFIRRQAMAKLHELEKYLNYEFSSEVYTGGRLQILSAQIHKLFAHALQRKRLGTDRFRQKPLLVFRLYS